MSSLNCLYYLNYLPQWLIITYVLIFGLCVGSFLNVVILRGLTGESYLFSRSKCPKCQKQLSWYMNIPLISYIFLRGKCFYCKEKISIQYPIIELLVALLFIFSYFTFGLSLKFIFVCIILSLFTAMATTDILQTVIVDIHAYILAFVGFLASFFHIFNVNWLESLLCAVFSFVLFELFSQTGKFFCNQRIFGFGDSLIVLGLGTLFNYKGMIITIFLAILLQVVSALPLLIKKSFDEKKVKLALSYIFIILSILSVFIFKDLEGQNRLIYSILISVVLLVSLKYVLNEIKEKKSMLENIDDEDEQFEKSPFCLLPFGPALLISGAISLFYLEKLTESIKAFFF